MKFKHYLPIVIVIAMFGILVGANNFLTKTQSIEPENPQLYQSQAADGGNDLEKITNFELEIELKNDDEIEMHYWTDQEGTAQAIIDQDNNRTQDQAAQEQVQQLINSLPPLAQTEPLTLIQAVLDQLEISQNDLDEFELKYRLTDGTYNKIELEIEDDDDDDNDDD